MHMKVADIVKSGIQPLQSMASKNELCALPTATAENCFSPRRHEPPMALLSTARSFSRDPSFISGAPVLLRREQWRGLSVSLNLVSFTTVSQRGVCKLDRSSSSFFERICISCQFCAQDRR